MVGVVGMWASGVAVGWALVYWPHLPGAFAFSSALDPAEHSGPVDALYISLVIVATLGLGDIAPTEDWLRVVAPLEALVGFALLTATVSWVLGIYPALARRRALALRICHLRRAGLTPRQLDSGIGATVLDDLACEIARVCVDFAQYPESYYFHDGPGDTSLARTIKYAADLAEQAASATRGYPVRGVRAHRGTRRPHRRTRRPVPAYRRHPAAGSGRLRPRPRRPLSHAVESFARFSRLTRRSLVLP